MWQSDCRNGSRNRRETRSCFAVATVWNRLNSVICDADTVYTGYSALPACSGYVMHGSARRLLLALLACSSGRDGVFAQVLSRTGRPGCGRRHHPEEPLPGLGGEELARVPRPASPLRRPVQPRPPTLPAGRLRRASHVAEPATPAQEIRSRAGRWRRLRPPSRAVGRGEPGSGTGPGPRRTAGSRDRAAPADARQQLPRCPRRSPCPKSARGSPPSRVHPSRWIPSLRWSARG